MSTPALSSVTWQQATGLPQILAHPRGALERWSRSPIHHTLTASILSSTGRGAAVRQLADLGLCASRTLTRRQLALWMATQRCPCPAVTGQLAAIRQQVQATHCKASQDSRKC